MSTFDHAAVFGTTTNPCPAWCEDKPGHGYESGDHTCESRAHSRDFGDVSILAEEFLTYTEDGMTLRIEAPTIFVDEGQGLTGPQARQLAAKLLAAADMWDRVSRP